MMNNILIVEDEKPIRDMLTFALKVSGFTPFEAKNGTEMMESLQKKKPSLILLDWMLPDRSGIHLLKDLKKIDDLNNIPIIMLTARSQEDDKIHGLNIGADDYICKPFSTKELIARINAAIRFSKRGKSSNRIQYKDLLIDLDSHRVSVLDETINLAPTEFKLLEFLMTKPERVYSRYQLLDYIWGTEKYVDERTVDVHILRIRKAIAKWGYDQNIKTVRSIGYLFTAKVDQ